MKIALSIVIFVASFCTLALAQCGSNHRINYGYDSMIGNPGSGEAGGGIDPGWRRSFQITNNRSNDCRPAYSCTLSTVVRESRTMEAYSSYLNDFASLSSNKPSPLTGVEFHASSDYEETQAGITQEGLGYWFTYAMCHVETAFMIPNVPFEFTEGFINSVLYDIPADPSRAAEALEFIRDWGTSYVEEMRLGARMIVLGAFSKEGQAAYESEGHSWEAGASNFFAVTLGEDEFNSEGAAFDEYKEFALEKYMGSAPPADGNWATWANNITVPEPYAYELIAFTELLNSFYFPNDPDIDLRRETLEQAFLLYCTELGLPECQFFTPPPTPSPSPSPLPQPYVWFSKILISPADDNVSLTLGTDEDFSFCSLSLMRVESPQGDSSSYRFNCRVGFSVGTWYLFASSRHPTYLSRCQAVCLLQTAFRTPIDAYKNYEVAVGDNGGTVTVDLGSYGDCYLTTIEVQTDSFDGSCGSDSLCNGCAVSGTSLQAFSHGDGGHDSRCESHCAGQGWRRRDHPTLTAESSSSQSVTRTAVYKEYFDICFLSRLERGDGGCRSGCNSPVNYCSLSYSESLREWTLEAYTESSPDYPNDIRCGVSCFNF